MMMMGMGMVVAVVTIVHGLTAAAAAPKHLPNNLIPLTKECHTVSQVLNRDSDQFES